MTKLSIPSGASRGASAYPQIRFVSLAEIGTHVLFGTQMAGYTTSEIALSRTVLPRLERGMLCLADRNFFGFPLWNQAAATGADLLWRGKKNSLRLESARSGTGRFLPEPYFRFGARLAAQDQQP